MEYNVEKDGYPKKVGYYYVKILYDNNEFSGKYLWNGEDFVLPIGRPFTNEVVAWKE